MAEYIEKSGLKKSMSTLLSIENVPSDIKQLVMDIIDGEMLADVQPVNRTEWVEHGLSRYDSRTMKRYQGGD